MSNCLAEGIMTWTSQEQVNYFSFEGISESSDTQRPRQGVGVEGGISEGSGDGFEAHWSVHLALTAMGIMGDEMRLCGMEGGGPSLVDTNIEVRGLAYLSWTYR